MTTTITTNPAPPGNLEQFLSANLAEFRPLAYYDKHLDCIRVQIRDCSISEKRINRIFTVMEPNYSTDFGSCYVGFTIKGIRHLFNQLGLPLEGSYQLAELLDRIVRRFPESTVLNVTENLKGDKELGELQVDFAKAA